MTKFYRKVKQNRKKLKEAGFRPPTIHRWEYGKRIPSLDTALKLAQILGMDIRDIPYRRIELNQP